MPQSIDAASGVSPIGPVRPAPRTGSGPAEGGRAGFAGTLAKARQVRFSAHAQKRLASRNIRLDSRDLAHLARAADRAEAKGARDSLVLLNDLGLIVNVPSRTVVTALDDHRMQDGVFTDIDSTVIIRDSERQR